MSGNFSFVRTPDIEFGIGARRKLVEKIKLYGSSIILITGKKSFDNNPIAKALITDLLAFDVRYEKFIISNEPSPADVDEIVALNKAKTVDCVVSIGGGSVIDAGKAVSSLLTVDRSVKDYLEGVGQIEHPGTKVPFIAVPTTAGTGSEATKNAVLTEYGSNGFKKSLRHENFIPNKAIIDPELMVSCSPQVTAASGMDAFTQLLESYLSVKSTPLIDTLALSGIEQLIPSIEKAVFNGSDLPAREAMAYASMISGITLTNAGLGVVHGFAQPLGSMFPIPHGVACGTLMAATNRVTFEKILKEEIKTIALSKLATLGSFIAKKEGKLKDLAEVFIQYLEELTDKLSLPKLSDFGINEKDLDTIVAVTGQKNHCVKLNESELRKILELRL